MSTSKLFVLELKHLSVSNFGCCYLRVCFLWSGKRGNNMFSFKYRTYVVIWFNVVSYCCKCFC